LQDTLIDVIAKAFVTAQRAENGRHRVEARELGVTGITLESGLEVIHNPRSTKQQATSGVKSKHSRGETDAQRLKREYAVVKALDVKLTCTNVLSILETNKRGKHDVATDCQSWQRGLQAFKSVCHDNDMLTPFSIPTEFDVNDPSKTRGPFISLLDNFHDIDDATACRWQRYLQKNAA
jgi:hypothetical protein